MKQKKNLIYFHKMHAFGNDFAICLQFENQNIDFEKFLTPKQILFLGNRFIGIGFDQFVFVKQNNNANETFDFEMIIFNQDGSKSEICGNATRCCVFLINEFYNFEYLNLKIKSGSQILSCSLLDNEKKNPFVEVCFENHPKTFLPKDFNHANLSNNTNFDAKIIECENFAIEFCFFEINLTLCGYYADIGNPHLVFFSNKHFKWKEIEKIGKILTESNIFLNGINIGFCTLLNSSTDFLQSTSESGILKVFERGSGSTFACGSGACAAGFLGFQNKIFNKNDINFYFLSEENEKINEKNAIKIQINQSNKIKMISGFQYVFSGFFNFAENMVS